MFRSMSYGRDRTRAVALAAALATLAAAPFTDARAQSLLPVGSAVDIRNVVTASLATDRRQVDTGQPVHLNELIEATRDSRGEFSLLDDTRLVVASGARLILDRFVYDPTGQGGAVVMSLTRGAMRFVTGRSAKPAYQVKTPVASIGVRGTIFDAFVSASGELAVLLIEGAVEVCTGEGQQRRCLLHDRIGQFVHVRNGAPPRQSPRWDGTFLERQPIRAAFPFVEDPPSFQSGPGWRYDDIMTPGLPLLPPPPPRDPGPPNPPDRGGEGPLLPPNAPPPGGPRPTPGGGDDHAGLPPPNSPPVEPADPPNRGDGGGIVVPWPGGGGGGGRLTFCERYPYAPRCRGPNEPGGDRCKRYPRAPGCGDHTGTPPPVVDCKRTPHLPGCHAGGGTPPPVFDCKRYPRQPGCRGQTGTPPPVVDCKRTPHLPGCHAGGGTPPPVLDCKRYPRQPGCRGQTGTPPPVVDCKRTPHRPGCGGNAGPSDPRPGSICQRYPKHPRCGGVRPPRPGNDHAGGGKGDRGDKGGGRGDKGSKDHAGNGGPRGPLARIRERERSERKLDRKPDIARAPRVLEPPGKARTKPGGPRDVGVLRNRRGGEAGGKMERAGKRWREPAVGRRPDRVVERVREARKAPRISEGTHRARRAERVITRTPRLRRPEGRYTEPKLQRRTPSGTPRFQRATPRVQRVAPAFRNPRSMAMPRAPRSMAMPRFGRPGGGLRLR
jgi:hypothetical protein